MSLRTKGLLKDYCKYLYYSGAGNCWYEDIYHETVVYKLYSYITLSIYIILVILENLAAAFGSFPAVEKNSAVLFALSHNIVLAKIFIVVYHKDSIKQLNREMAAIGEEFEEEKVMKRQYVRAKYGILSYVVTVFLCLVAHCLESTRKSIVEDAPFYTVVTYWPSYEDPSMVAAAFRILSCVAWLYMMLPMMSTDCVPILHLVTMTHKFMTLRHHFERIREQFDKDILTMRKEDAVEKLRNGCLAGIVMHQKLMFLVDEITRVFGTIMSLQVCESSATAVLALLRLALSSHLDLSKSFMTFIFVIVLFILLALNLWNAGEITYQASLLPDAVFYCGWHMCELDRRPRRDIRRLVLIACTQAQKPLILKAFGIQDLSYSTFVSVARMTYSVFAVFYQRGS